MADQDRGRGVQSVEVSVALLTALARHGAAMPLTDLAAAAGMAPAKVHRYLASFIESGMVRQRTSGKYDLGPRAAEIGIAAVARIDPVNSAADGLSDLVEQTGMSATLAVWGTHGATVIRWERAATALVTTLGVGSVLPVTRSATGRIFLAHLPDRLLADLVSAEGTNLAATEPLRADIRSIGIAIADQEFIPGLYALACPVMDVQGSPVAVVTLVATDRKVLKPNHPARQQLRAYCAR
ncbi:transcriptional regulator, IclR family [Sulfitobacter brevis]|uniref:Transcriptional regulator, IclR family n=1 Tax=Sulfitobacter brevis TaxID=74348 RepID=A0A1I1Y401_9RHOB|nr:IclR family transcriptional regulator [Sulfitobacter brevis]SFE12823.1 transcriptional regulator, IclR family [Sulfitobacter brevis]